MYGFSDCGFEDILKGEFAGKIYHVDKFLPVIETMRENPLLADFLSNIENSPNSLIYFNSQSKTVFAINYREKAGRIRIEILKPSAQDLSEVHKFSYRLTQIFPTSLLTITDEYHDQAELESA